MMAVFGVFVLEILRFFCRKKIAEWSVRWLSS